MMIIVNNLDFEQITGSLSGEPFSISFDEKKFQLMKELEKKANEASSIDELKAILEEFRPLTQESYKEIVESACPFIVVNKSTNKFYLTYNGQVSSKAMPTEFAEAIIKSTDKGIDPTPLVKMWVRVLRNPNYTDKKAKLIANYVMAPYTNREKLRTLMDKEGLSWEVAFKKSTTTQVAVTQEGLLCCYKVSRELFTRYELDENEQPIQKSRYKKTIDADTGLVTMEEPEHVEDRLFEPWCQGTSGDAFYCGSKLGHHIKVGQVHYLESWDQVNCDDSCSALPGLHVGGLSYINGFQNGDNAVTHCVFVDPMHIGAVVGLGNGNDGAMRVKQYFVYGSFKGVNKTLYHSSDYAKTTDKEYEAMLEAAVEATKMQEAELAQFKAEANALVHKVSKTVN